VRKNIDTGAGLERILSISQNAPTNFDTDLFLPAIERLTKINDIPYQIDAYFSRKKEQSLINQYYRVIVDHLKANLFAIADGEIPSNKERGAILRRLLRRAIVFARKLNFKDEFIKPTIDELVKIYESFYPHLSTAKKQVLDAIQAEYRQFNKTLDKGLQLFFQAIKGKEKLDGETVFSLVDTYGFPFEIIKELSIEHNVLIDEAKYQELIANRAITSRANKKVVAMDKQANDLINFLDQSEFLYDDKTLTANIIAIFDQNFQRMENGAGDC
jgi:alanyl-tRNA synthetase